MANSFDSEWWNGVQAVGWILFRAPETVELLEEGRAAPLLEMIEGAPYEIAREYGAAKFSHDSAFNDLLHQMCAGRVRWTHSVDNIEGSTADASRLDIAFHHHFGLYAHTPLFGPDSSNKNHVERISLRFRRDELMVIWPAPETKVPTREPSPYWDILQIVAYRHKAAQEGRQT